MKRYLVKMEFFVWAESDREAIAVAESKAKKSVIIMIIVLI